MDLLNFEIQQNIYFVTENHELDIHNNYDCSGFSYDFQKKQMMVLWTKGTGDWVPKNIPLTLKLIFHEVLIFKAAERDSKMSFSEDGCISDIGFVWHNTNDDNLNSVILDKQDQGFTFFSLRFQSGFIMYIDSQSAELRLE